MPDFRKHAWSRYTAPLLILALVAAPLGAVDVKSLKPQGYVSDFAHVVSPAEKAQIEDYCGRVERATGAQMALVTIPTLDGAPIEDFANDLFRSWGVGKKGQDNGVLLLLVINDRKSRIEVGYGLEPDLPDGFVGDTLRSMRPALRARQYGAAMLAGAQTMGERIAAAKKVSLDAAPAQPLQQPMERRGRPGPSPASMIFGILIILLLIRIFLGRGGVGGFLAGMFLGNLFGEGGRGRDDDWGGGGFGDGGGFGGFGGGDSGGGGASSDW